MLGHRVVTLHPAVHGGILARRDIPEDVADLAEHGISPIDLVVVNLYPFTEVASRHGVTEEEAVEMIDIGGPALLRGAAKNFLHVAAVARPERYGPVLEELRETGELSVDTRRSLGERGVRRHRRVRVGDLGVVLRPGDVPGGADPDVLARAVPCLRREPAPAGRVLRGGGRAPPPALAGRAAERARALVQQPERPVRGQAAVEEFTLPACVIVKHANPCGVAVAGAIEDAYARAVGSDPVSAYGGVVVLNRPVSVELAERIAEQFVEVLFAPGYEDGALGRAERRRRRLRILDSTERRNAAMGERDYRRVLGGLLAQDRDSDVEDREEMIVVCGDPSESDWGDLLFAWRVCKHVTSNAIVIAKDLRTIGIGAGQMSRVDAVRLAVEKARGARPRRGRRRARLRRVLPVPRRPDAGTRRSA